MEKILRKFLPKSDRSLNIIRHIGLSILYKGSLVLVGLLLVPLSIQFLGSEKYGVWLTLFSFVQWFSFFNFGIGNGLRNKLTEAFANNDDKLAQVYVSSAYITVSLLVVLFISIVAILFPYINWNFVFNFESNDEMFTELIFITFVFFLLNLLFKLVVVIFYSSQKSSAPDFINLLGQIFVLLSLFGAVYFSGGSIFIYGCIVMGAELLVFIFATVIIFMGKYKNIRPSVATFEIGHAKEIIGLGGKFFVIQIAATILYATDNFIINQLFGGSEVTVYNVAFRYFSLITIGMSIILTPFWSSFTDAFAKNDLVWIKKSLATLLKALCAAAAMTLFMIVFADEAYLLWVGDLISVPYSLSVIMGVNTSVAVVLHLLSMMMNGAGKVKLQMYIASFAAIINIPLSIFLAVNFNMGVSGIIFATLLCNMLGLFVYPFQAHKLINNKAHGIWNE